MDQAVATFHGIQPACVDLPRYELWKLARPIGEYAAGRVLPRNAIEDLGYKLPVRTPNQKP